MIFIHLGNENIAKILIEYNADVNATQIDEWTPLHIAVWNGKCPKCCIQTTTILESRFICIAGHVNIVEFIIKRGTNVNARQIEKKTPLHMAAEKGNYSNSYALERILHFDFVPFTIQAIHISQKFSSNTKLMSTLKKSMNGHRYISLHSTVIVKMFTSKLIQSINLSSLIFQIIRWLLNSSSKMMPWLMLETLTKLHHST